jgi:hypothetical protein
MNPKVLVVAPIYDGKDYCVDLYVETIENLDYDNYDHIVVDNSDGYDDWFFKKLQFLVGKNNAFKVPRGRNSREAINNAMNFARQYFLERDYDYMLVVESDLFPRKDTIKRLLSYQKAVVGSFYLLGFEEDDKPYYEFNALYNKRLISLEVLKESIKGLQPRRACIFELDRKENGVMGTKNIGVEKTPDYYMNGLRQVHGVGLGCTLIRRDIIQRFPFWTDSRFDNKHHDVYFYMDLHNKGIPVFCDTDVLVHHMPSRWSTVPDM